MIKLIYFIGGWIVGLFALNGIVFNTLFQFIKNENAVAILCVMIVSVYTVVLGIIVGRK